MIVQQNFGHFFYLPTNPYNFIFRLVQASYDAALQKTFLQETSEPLRGYRCKSLQMLLKQLIQC